MAIKRPERMFDVRLRARFLDEKLISKEDEKKFLESLPDCEDNLEVCDLAIERSSSLEPERK